MRVFLKVVAAAFFAAQNNGVAEWFEGESAVSEHSAGAKRGRSVPIKNILTKFYNSAMIEFSKRRVKPDGAPERRFRVMSREGEIALLKSDDSMFSRTKRYLDGLILDALDKFEFERRVYDRLHAELLGDVVDAGKCFFTYGHDRDAKNFKFSTYFTWYIAQRINSLNPKRKSAHPSCDK